MHSNIQGLYRMYENFDRESIGEFGKSLAIYSPIFFSLILTDMAILFWNIY